MNGGGMKKRLTFQQAEAFRLFCLGLCRKEAAREMDVEANTFSHHLHGARRRLHKMTLRERADALTAVYEPRKIH